MIKDAFKLLQHIKTVNLYVHPTTQDAETVDNELKTGTEDLVNTALEFN